MIAEELIDHTFPFLRPSDSVGRSIDIMEDNHINQLVLANGLKYHGLINLEILEDMVDQEILLKDVMPDHINTFATVNQHIMEVLQKVQSNDLQSIAVLDNDNNFKGTIPTTHLMAEFAKTLGNHELGAVIVLAIKNRDYSLSEICRLIESNDTKVISSYYSTGSQEFNYKNTLTLKLNRVEISHVVATLERFGYEVEAAFANAPIENMERSNYGHLMKYLEI